MEGRPLIRKNFLILLASLLILSLLNNFACAQKAVLSSRWFHPREANDSVKTIDAINDFKPQRIEWTYTQDSNVTKIYRSMGLAYSLTLNPQYPDSMGHTSLRYRIKTLDDRGYIAPWMKSWDITNPYWGCVNNPLFRELFYTKAEKLVKMGAYGIFIDDALFNAQLKFDNPNSHGCFCEYCVAGYTKKSITSTTASKTKTWIENELKNNRNFVNDYENYQEESVVNFLSNLKKKLVGQNPNIKMIANNSNGQWNSIYKVFDKGVGELSIGNLNTVFLSRAYKIADELKKEQLFTLVTDDLELQDWLIFYNYLNEKDYLIPWDILIDTQSQKRFYMKPEYYKRTMQFLKGEIIPFNKVSSSSIDENIWVKVLKVSDKDMRLIVLNTSPIQRLKGEFMLDAGTLIKNLNKSIVLRTSTIIDNGKYAIYNLTLR